jgi:hypothetical protein
MMNFFYLFILHKHDALSKNAHNYLEFVQLPFAVATTNAVTAKQCSRHH